MGYRHWANGLCLEEALLLPDVGPEPLPFVGRSRAGLGWFPRKWTWWSEPVRGGRLTEARDSKSAADLDTVLEMFWAIVPSYLDCGRM